MFECVCGFKGNASHSKTCNEYSKETVRVTDSLSTYISKIYIDNYSVTDCCRVVKDRENTILSEAKLRKIITTKLDELGIRESLSGDNLNKKRQEKLKNTMLARYGVKNNGQRKGQGWENLNKIKYTPIAFDEEFKLYRKRIDYLTRKYVELLKRKGTIPTTCYYTGIEFKDVAGKVNPNDPYKRTVDHKIPVVEMFLSGKTPEETCAPENIVFCLRIVNTYKSNSPEDYFIEKILPYIKEKL